MTTCCTLGIVGLDKHDSNVTMHDTPALNTLHSDPASANCQQKWNYQSAVGCMSYLQMTIHPDITLAIHQYTCFATNPQKTTMKQ